MHSEDPDSKRSDIGGLVMCNEVSIRVQSNLLGTGSASPDVAVELRAARNCLRCSNTRAPHTTAEQLVANPPGLHILPRA